MSDVKIALVGCGGWGKNIARVLAQLGWLNAIVDPAPAARELAEQYKVLHRDSLQPVLDDDSIDAVAVAAPAELHFDIATQVLNAGKHVYVEKPIALDLAEGRKLAQLAEAGGRVLMVGHLLQYHPAYLALQELIRDGRLGNLRHIVSTRTNLGVLRGEEDVMWSFSPHDFSMVLGLAPGAVKSVSMIGSSFLQEGLVDFSTVHLRFDDQITAEVRASWLYPTKTQELVVVGSKAMAVFDDRAPWENKLRIKNFSVEFDTARPRAVPGDEGYENVPHGEPLTLEMEHFVHCVRNGVEPRTGGTEANAVLAVMTAASRSHANNGEWNNV